MFCLRLFILPLLIALAFQTACDFTAVEMATAAEIQETAEMPDTAALQMVLDGWAKALGGRERLAAAGIRHSRIQVQMFGFDGVVEDWLAPDGRHRFDLDLGGIFKITLVRTPEVCWIMDQNGKVSEQAGKDLQDEITSVYLETWSHLLPGQGPDQMAHRMPGRVEYLGRDADNGYHAVRCLPEGGTPITFYIDGENMLPVRSEQPFHSGETMTATYEEWREIEGILHPGRVVQTTGTPENDIVATLVTVTYGENPPPHTFAKPAESAKDYRFTTGHEARNIPLDLNGVHIFLQVRINDSEPLWLILDTGASVTAIDSELARELGFTLEGKLMGGGAGEGKAEVNFIKDASFSVPGVEVTGQTVATIALSDILEARIGRRIDGVLGYDFISRFVVEIDYQHSKLHLYDKNSYSYEGDGEVVPIRLVGSSPHCDAVISVPGREPIHCDFLVDTGAGSALNFSKPFTDEHDLLTALPRKFISSGGFGIGGESKMYIGRIEGLRVGSLEFASPACSFSLDERGAGADATTAGLLGGRILEQCTVIFDYEGQRMILEPTARFGSPIDLDMSGLTFDTGGRGDWHTFTVRHVVEGSPAYQAGVEVDDVIVSVDGQPASTLRAVDLANMFREDGSKIVLGIRRGEKNLEKTLKLKPFV